MAAFAQLGFILSSAFVMEHCMERNWFAFGEGSGNLVPVDGRDMDGLPLRICMPLC